MADKLSEMGMLNAEIMAIKVVTACLARLLVRDASDPAVMQRRLFDMAMKSVENFVMTDYPAAQAETLRAALEERVGSIVAATS